MADYDGFLKNSVKHQRTKILPLRWIGNISSNIATKHLIEAIHMNDHDDYGFMYHFHGRMWLIFNKPYQLWGTYYTVKLTDSDSLES